LGNFFKRDIEYFSKENNARFYINFQVFSLWLKSKSLRLKLIEKLDRIYESCILGKQHRESFPTRKSIHPNKPLDIVHEYLCGPMKKPSIGGS
jgi:hypothetical protein